MMDITDPFAEFLGAVKTLRDEGAIRVCAHTSSVSADAWIDQEHTGTPYDAKNSVS
jgi:hypothetical protein